MKWRNSLLFCRAAAATMATSGLWRRLEPRESRFIALRSAELEFGLSLVEFG